MGLITLYLQVLIIVFLCIILVLIRQEEHKRRRLVRKPLKIPLEVTYTINGTDSSTYRANTENISIGGARIFTSHFVPQGSIVRMQVILPVKKEPVPIKARVAWVKKEYIEGHQQIYDTGFEFISIPEKNKDYFFQYIWNNTQK